MRFGSCWRIDVLLLTIAMAALGAAAAPVVLTGDGVQVTIDETGVAAVRVGGRQVAEGGLWAWDAAPWFKLEPAHPNVALGGHGLYPHLAKLWPDRQVRQDGPNRVRVRHAREDAVATWTYTLAGEDLAAACRLENLADQPWRVPAMGGLWVDFGTVPTGRLPLWHSSYLAVAMTGVFHPGHNNNIGGTWGQGDGFGVGTTPLPVRIARTLTMWDYESWAADRREQDRKRCFSHLRGDAIPPGGALTFGFGMRFSADRSWQHLLTPYRDAARAALGPAAYATDHRLVLVEHVNRDFQSIGPQNPYGFHGGYRRLDLPEGVKELCDMLIPAMKQANMQGIIFWGQTGQNPRGGMYRTDFDVMPPEVLDNWPTLRERFAAAGLKLGATTRPGQITLRKDWATDAVYRLNEADPEHLAMLTERFRNMIDRGCTLFYLDSFGSTFEDVIIMRHLRAALGPDIQTYAEHPCDLIAAFTGFYSETDFWAAGSAKGVTDDHWNVRTGTEFLEVVRWLFGDVPCISRAYDVHGKIPAGFEPFRTFAWRHRITPMIEGYRSPKLAPELAAEALNYVTPTGKWK